VELAYKRADNCIRSDFVARCGRVSLPSSAWTAYRMHFCLGSSFGHAICRTHHSELVSYSHLVSVVAKMTGTLGGTYGEGTLSLEAAIRQRRHCDPDDTAVLHLV
jgi:hypothetical protein